MTFFLFYLFCPSSRTGAVYFSALRRVCGARARPCPPGRCSARAAPLEGPVVPACGAQRSAAHRLLSPPVLFLNQQKNHFLLSPPVPFLNQQTNHFPLDQINRRLPDLHELPVLRNPAFGGLLLPFHVGKYGLTSGCAQS